MQPSGLYLVQEAYADQPCLFIHQEVLRHEKANNYIYDGLEMGVAISGQGTLLYQDTTIRLVPGDAYFLESTTPHALNPDSGDYLENLFVHIKHESIGSLAPPDRLSDLIRPFCLAKSGAAPPVLHCVRKVNDNLTSAFAAYKSKDPNGYFSAWSFVIKAVIEINRRLNKKVYPDPDVRAQNRTAILNRAIDFIHKHYLQDISLQDIAEHCCVSVSGLSELFKTRMRSSPVKFRNRLRINKGILLLKTTDYTIERVAEECGFSDVSSFRRLLSHMTNCNPQQIRSGALKKWERYY